MPVVRSSIRVVQDRSEFCTTVARITFPAETDMSVKSTSGSSGASSHQPTSSCCTPPMQSLRTPVWRRSPADAPPPPIPTHVDTPASAVWLQSNVGIVNCPDTSVTGVVDGTTYPPQLGLIENGGAWSRNERRATAFPFAFSP